MAVLSKVAFLAIAAAAMVGGARKEGGFKELGNALVRWSGVAEKGGIWRILAILFALGNLKNLPFVWHLRFVRAFSYQLYYQPTPIPPSSLFKPIVTSTRTPIMEMDYNLHKSNSTYFSDMDISRTHLFTALIRNAIHKNSRLTGHRREFEGMGATEGTAASEKRGKHMIALGGISCMFKKEILPYQKFEMWTRLLSWDRKWFYLVTHLVRPGVGAPESYSLQPWKKGVKRVEKVDREKLKGAVFATALAKYVVKKGRITIPPEQALLDADMVPIKPEGWTYNPDLGHANGSANGDVGGVLPQTEGEEWTWDIIEAERLRGLQFAENFAALEGLHEVWDGGEKGVLGEYPDLLWA
ncbi:hypothetical protein BDV96DRAFT_568940 [Lophiotrema nucula]|uniref:Capsule polysaccharide biosynthesis protein n=1 Tax=Lophiotrema nucula TaxID=690887 RepID=A0A6A5ZJ21_9PLEO|nr:hypothetical protein BDV96DRAFT_568940 [Lophiotrema nucula]